MKHIVWRGPDGSIEITSPVQPMIAGEAEEAYLARIATHTRSARVAAGLMDENTVVCGYVDDAELARLDRGKRAGWRWDEGRGRLTDDG
jgi:hypothetical protein